MLKKILLVSGTLMFFVSQSQAAEVKIDAYKAPFYVGQTVMACGVLAETKHLSNRHYLNLGNKYPKQNLTILVWNKDYRWFEDRFGKIDNLVGRKFCARGKIEDYKNNLQIQIANPQYLRLMNK